MRFSILGPLAVAAHDRDVPVTAGRERVVLAMLLLAPGQIVGAETLIDALWEDEPPATARGQLQTCVSRLRRTLPGVGIVTHPEGYGIRLATDDLDATVFGRLLAEARAGGDPASARRRFRQALDLWRGGALSGIDSPAVRRVSALLDEQYAAAVEDWADLALEDHADRELVAELTGLVQRFPFRERLRAQLMLALYRTGRQADALEEYRRARAILRDELGVEPSTALEDMHRRLLTGDVTMPTRPAATAEVCTLPRTVGDFTGRAGLVDDLVNAAAAGPNVTAIDGMAGSGKTTLAVHVAGLLGDRYPDARLYIDLRGHSAKVPIEPAAAQVTLLRQLGVEAGRIPSDADERGRLWQAALASRRAVLVLDNAASSAQVEPLLPAAGAVVVLVTSRRRLLGLDGVRPISLDVLPEVEAVALLGAIVGDRVAAEPETAAEVVRRCGRLPLAIRLAGSRLAHRPRWRLADLARRMSDAALPELAAEDRTVADAFALSYRQLPQPARQIFPLLGLYPGERLGAVHVAALADLTLPEAQDVLDDLVDVHLVEEPAPGRYRLHDLVREFARTLGGLSRDEHRRAVGRMLDLILHVSDTLTRRAEEGMTFATGDYPAEQPKRPELVDHAVDDPEWFEALRSVLPKLVRTAASVGENRVAWQLARSSWRHLYFAGYTDEVITVMGLGLDAARVAADMRGIVVMNNFLASGYHRLGRYHDAIRCLQEALACEVRLGDRLSQSRIEANLSACLLRLGRFDESIAANRRAYVVYRELNHPHGMAVRLCDLSTHLLAAGRTEEALDTARHALLWRFELGRSYLTSIVLMNLGMARARLGAPRPAERLLTAALRLTERDGPRMQIAEVVNELGRIAAAGGRLAEAVERHLAAREIVRETGDRRYEAVVTNDLGTALRAMDDGPGALELHRHALQLARRHGYEPEEGRALTGIGHCLSVAGEPEEARRSWRRALEIFDRLELPERFELARLVT